MTTDFEPLLQALSRREDVSAEEQDMIRGLPAHIRTFQRGEEMVAEYSRPQQSCLMLEGISARIVNMQEGKRQITALQIPGDFVDLHGLFLKTMDHSVSAASACKVMFIPHRDLIALITNAPHLGRLLWLSTLIDSAIQRACITCIGRRSALAHLAHLLCEFLLRFNVVGLATRNRFEFALTQIEIADALGISCVHVNRVVQELRATGLVLWKGHTIEIVDFEGLKALAEFDPTYLHLAKEAR